MKVLSVWLAVLRQVRRASLALCVVWLSASQPTRAASLAIVLSDESAPYQEVYEAIRARADDRDMSVSRMYAPDTTEAMINARLVVAVGVRAAESVANLPGRAPVLVVLVPKNWYRKTGKMRLTGNARRSVSAIYLDQPYARQVSLIRLAFPDVKRVGVLVSASEAVVHEEIGPALRAQGLTLVSEILETDQKLIVPLEKIFSQADLMLAIPDPEVFNRTSAQSVLLTSYRYHDPVVGYSRSLTRAGALVSLYSTPTQIGRQAAEMILKQFESANSHLPDAVYPRYFSVSVNLQVARALGFTMLPEAELERRLAGSSDD